MNYLRSFSLFILLLLVFQEVGCKKNSTDTEGDISYTDLTGEYLGQEPPDMTPIRFAPEILRATSSWFWHGPPVFSPDGNELYFTKYFIGTDFVKIYYMKQENGRWTAPAPAGFLNRSEENYPVFSADGRTLYFLSPASGSCIFSTNLTTDGWSTPQRLEISTPYSMNIGSEFSVTREGNIYFELTRDIYYSEYSNGTYSPAVRLDEPVSTEHIETGPYVDPDERYLIFGSHRPGGYGESDLYICFKNSDDTWTEPVNMGGIINSNHAEIFPLVSPDGNYLFFITKKTGDDGLSPYWIDANIIDELR